MAQLSVLKAIVVLASTGELAMLLLRNLNTPFLFHIEMGKLLGLFGYFLMILLGLKLLEILKVYLNDNKVHMEVVLLVAAIAIARKIIFLALKLASPGRLLARVEILTAHTGKYFIIRRWLPEPSN